MRRVICILLIIFNIALFNLNICGLENSDRDVREYTFNNVNKAILKVISVENKEIDILKLSLLLSKEVFPDANMIKYTNEINRMVRDIKKVINKKNDPVYRIGVINDYLYKTNGYKYDVKDMGAKLDKNQFITGNIDTKEGSCITMPLLFYVIGKELDLPVTWVRAPEHFFCRYYVDEVSYINIESTSGGKTAIDEVYISDFKITEEELKKNVYMQSLDDRGCAGDLLCIIATYYARHKDMNKAIDYYMASLMLEPANPFTYRFLSLVYGNLGYKDRSKEYMNKAIELGYKKIDRF